MLRGLGLVFIEVVLSTYFVLVSYASSPCTNMDSPDGPFYVCFDKMCDSPWVPQTNNHLLCDPSTYTCCKLDTSDICPYQCVADDACQKEDLDDDNDYEPITDKYCRDDSKICCKITINNVIDPCECTTNGGTCSDTRPGDDYEESGSLSCDAGCSPVGAPCWIQVDDPDGCPGSAVCLSPTSFQCMDPQGACDPVAGIPAGVCCAPEDIYEPTEPGEVIEMVYTGPIIDTLQEVLVPIGAILYYGGLFIGVSFIIYSGYKLMVSQGNPQVTKEAQEQLTAAILGILFILLSAAILRVIINYVFNLTGMKVTI